MDELAVIRYGLKRTDIPRYMLQAFGSGACRSLAKIRCRELPDGYEIAFDPSGLIRADGFVRDLRSLTALLRRTTEAALDAADLSGDTRRKYVLGDGCCLAYRYLSQNGVLCTPAPEALRFQNAAGVALAAARKAAQGQTVGAKDLSVSYLRVSQAERERLARLSGSGKT